MAPSPSNRYGLRPSLAKRPWTNMSRSASLARLCCCRCAVFIAGPPPFDWFERRELVLVSFLVCLFVVFLVCFLHGSCPLSLVVVVGVVLFLLKFLFFLSLVVVGVVLFLLKFLFFKSSCCCCLVFVKVLVL